MYIVKNILLVTLLVSLECNSFIHSLIHSCTEQMDLLCAEVRVGNKSDNLLQRPQAPVCISGVQGQRGLGSSPKFRHTSFQKLP